jgi:hypothetical protein
VDNIHYLTPQSVTIEELLPAWAIGRANGNYLAIGACLPTRDGRKIGNATVIDLEVKDYGTVATVVTDAGNKLKLILEELMGYFYSPEWIASEAVGLRCHLQMKDSGGTK